MLRHPRRSAFAPAFLAACLLLLAQLLLPGCDSETEAPTAPEEPKTEGRLSGQVWQRLNPTLPLAGAALRWDQSSATTDETGAYVLESLPEGADSLRVELEGFLPESRWVSVSSDSQRVSFTLMPLDTVPPPAPASFSVRPQSGTHLVLSWTAPADMADVVGYFLTKSPGDPYSQLFDLEITEWEDLTVSPSRSYNYELFTRDASGNLSAALVGSGQVDALPTASAITMSASSFDSIAMTWPPCPDEDFLAYRLYRSEEASADSTDLLLLTDSTSTTSYYVDRDVQPNEVYRYRLYTYDSWEQVNAASSRRGAAQEFISLDSEPMLILPLPGANQIFVAARQYLYLADGDGALLDSLTMEDFTQRWLISDDGSQAWGLDEYSRIARVDLSSFTLAAITDMGDLGYDLANLGDGRLVVSLADGGAPLLFDDSSLALLGELAALSDQGESTLLAADPAGPLIYLAEGSDALRLRSVDLAGGATILDSSILPDEPDLMHLRPGDLLQLGYTFRDSLYQVVLDPGNPGNLDSLVWTSLGNVGPWRGNFNADGSQLWLKLLGGDYRVRGYDTQTGAALQVFEQVANFNAAMMLDDGSRVATALVNFKISLCNPTRDHGRSQD